MGLPNISITFQSLANSAIQRLSHGVVGLIVTDTMNGGAYSFTRASQVKKTLDKLGANNLAYIERAFIGYINTPKTVIVYVLSPDDELDAALDYMATQAIDYLAGPPDISPADAQEIVTWIGDQRAAGKRPKAVLPETAADDYAIVNVTTEDIAAAGIHFTPAQYCSRIAGLIAGTPPTISCTYAPLPEVTGVAALSKEEMDAAIDRGEFILFSDGTKIKVGRAVNSFQNKMGNPNLNDSFKKIKIVEAMDMIYGDIRITAQDTYIGKYANSYDNKCLLISAIADYFEALVRQGILNPNSNTIGIDVSAQEEYLLVQGVDIAVFSEQEIKEANTGSRVFLAGKVSILDAIEDIALPITI